MYFWKIDSLVQELKDGTLSQKERMKYLLATTIVLAIALELPYLFPQPASVWTVLQSVVFTFIMIAGTIYCYVINRNGDDKEFIDRFICIGWTVGFRLLVLFLPTYLVFGVIGTIIVGDEFLESISPANFLFATIIYLLSYLLMGKHMKRVAGRRPKQTTAGREDMS